MSQQEHSSHPAAALALLARAGGAVVTLSAAPGRPHTLASADGLDALLGRTARDVQAEPDFWRAIVHPDDRERLLAELAAGAPRIDRLRLHRPDGRDTWVDVHLAPLASGATATIQALLLDVTARVRAEADARESAQRAKVLTQRLDGFVQNIPGILWESYFQQSPADSIVDYVSPMIEPMSGYTAEQWKQPNFWLELIHPEDRPGALAASGRVFHDGHGTASYRWVTRDGRILWVTSRMLLIRDDAGAPIGLRGVTVDETSVKHAEAQRVEVRMREEIIRAQEESLLMLSTPLVPIDDDIMAMPLIGALDPRRVERILHTLLDGVSRSGARTVILDITGVPAMDEQSADALIRAARAVSLLGAEAVLTGIRPEVATALVALSTDLRALVTCSTLKAGIAYAMNRRRR